jgi:hypothetical protein
VPLIINAVASFTHYLGLPPAKRLFWFFSCGLRQVSEEAVDASGVLEDML